MTYQEYAGHPDPSDLARRFYDSSAGRLILVFALPFQLLMFAGLLLVGAILWLKGVDHE